MFDINFWVLGGIALFFLLLGALITARNPRSAINRTVLYFTFAVALWIWTNIVFQLVNDQMAYPIALLSYFAASLIGVYVLRFALLLTAHQPSRYLLLFGWAFSFATLLPGFLATNVKDHSIITTPFLNIYAVFLVGHFIATTVVLFKHRKVSFGVERARTNTMLIGLGLSFVGGSIFNLILPLMGNYSVVQFGPLMSAPLVTAMILAIIRQRLFDIRFALARTATYTLLLFTLLLLYASAVFTVIQLFFGGEAAPSIEQSLVYMFAGVFLAFTYEPLRKFFNRVTDRIFFQHVYDVQGILNRLGDIAVGETDLQRLSERSLKVLADALKPETASIYILSKSEGKRIYNYHYGRVAEATKQAITTQLLPVISTNHNGVIVRDELDDSQSKLKEAMEAANCALMVRLQTSRESVGFLYLGPKQNGSIYNTKDMQLLETVVDELAVALQNGLRFQEIKDFNLTLQAKIAEATAQLRTSNSKLRKLDEAKDEFISMASHQLRTPLTSVKGYISMALEGDAGKLNEQQRKLLGEAFISAQRMVYLIGDFLNVSRIQTGKFVIEAKPINLAELVAEEVDQLIVTAQRRNIKLEYHKPASIPPMNLDEDKMRQVIMNFIDNAIYYSKPNSTVNIELLTTARDVQLKVKDTGIGVPDTERHHLFTKFYRAANAREVRPDGTGVGLFMAKKVIMAHGGSVIFESQVGKGSTFGFSMPLSLAAKTGLESSEPKLESVNK